MIHRIRLKNFKAWKDSGDVTLAPVTMLLGTNSSGKSTLLQSLLLLKQTVNSPDRTIHLNLGGDEVNDFFNFGDFDDVLTKGTTPREFELAFDFERHGAERVTQGQFACSYLRNSSGAVAIKVLKLTTGERYFEAERQGKGAYSIRVDKETQARLTGRDCAPERSIAFPAGVTTELGEDGEYLQDLSLAIRRELEAIVYLGPLRRKPERDYVWNKSKPGEIGADGHKVMDALLASELLKAEDQHKTLEGVSKWLKKMGVAERVEVRQIGRSSRYELLVHKDRVAANLRDVGIGVSQVLPVLTVAYFAPRGSTVLLEEPEIHLHPLAQSVLAEMFVEVSRMRNVQFLVETHSEHLFRRMQTLIAQGETNAEKCQMLFVERKGKNASLRRLDVDEFGAVHNWPDHFFGDAVGEARAQALARAKRMQERANA